MDSSGVLNFDMALRPIEGDNPAGEDLRADTTPSSPYYKIKDARSSARAAERAADIEGDDAIPDEWRTVLSLGGTLIETKAKDLEVAAWMVEALVRLHGFAGLREGFRLVRGLVEGFWDNLYPLADEDGLETKVGPLTGLNGEGAPGTLIQPIRKIMITGSGEPGPYATWQHESASELAKITDNSKRQERIAAGAVTLDMIKASVKATPPSFFRTLLADLDGCREEFAALEKALDERCGADAPPGGNIREVLEQVTGLVRYLSADILPPETAAEDPVADEAEAAGTAAAPRRGPALSGPIQSREEAFAALAAVAGFFRQAEPQSLIPAMLENVMRRGRMPLSELLAELVPESGDRDKLYLRAGIQPPPDA